MSNALELVSRDEVKTGLQTKGGTDDVTALTLAETFVKSGLFPDVQSVSVAAVKILIGRDIGIGPGQAMQQIYLFKGKIGYQSGIIATAIKRSGKYNYKVKELTDDRCTLEFYERFEDGAPLELSGTYTFTMKDAQRAGFTSNAKYKELPSQMLMYKCVALGSRIFCPDVLCGGYDIEELRSIPDDRPPVSLADTLKAKADALRQSPPAPHPEPANVIDAEPVSTEDYRADLITAVTTAAAKADLANLSAGELETLDLLRDGDPGESIVSTGRLETLLRAVSEIQ